MRSVVAVVALVACVHAGLWTLLQQKTAVPNIDGPLATVTFSGVAKQGGLEPIFDRATATCASTYCHGATLAA